MVTFCVSSYSYATDVVGSLIHVDASVAVQTIPRFAGTIPGQPRRPLLDKIVGEHWPRVLVDRDAASVPTPSNGIRSEARDGVRSLQ